MASKISPIDLSTSKVKGNWEWRLTAQYNKDPVPRSSTNQFGIRLGLMAPSTEFSPVDTTDYCGPEIKASMQISVRKSLRGPNNF